MASLFQSGIGQAGLAQAGLAETLASLPSNPQLSAALDWFRRERAWINEQHLKLCRIPAATFFENDRATWMAEQLRAVGWSAKLDRAGNVVATLPGDDPSENKPIVAVTAHLDTVLAPRTAEDIKVLGDGRLEGPGVSDNGAGLAALLALASTWSSNRLSGFSESFKATPMLVATVGEEGEGNLSGMRYFCRLPHTPGGPKYRAFLVLDGPGVDYITSRALASRRFEIVFTGAGGHSWRDAQNANAVHALSRAITLFSDRVRDAGLAGRSTEESGDRAAFNFGIVDGGVSINSIPNEARAKLDLRSENAELIQRMAEMLVEAVEQAVARENSEKAGAPIAVRVKEIGSRPGGELAAGAPILESLRAVDQFLGIRSRLDCSSTDANIPLSLGWPAVSIGVGGQGGGAHTTAEWYGADGRELGLRRLLLTLFVLLTQPRRT